MKPRHPLRLAFPARLPDRAPMRLPARFAASMAAAFALGACATLPPAATAPPAAPGRSVALRLTGEVTRADFATYLELPFTAPEGVGRITARYTYTGRDQRTVLDLGLRGPDGLRGWSGSNKAGFTVSAFDATPSFRAGPIESGEWRIILGVPAIREGVVARYEVDVTLEPLAPAAAPAAAAPPPPSSAASAGGPGWRAGDFHTHTGHSDGWCPSASGVHAPCPVFLTLEAARAAGLDFVAVTDHNTLSHAAELNTLAPHFDDLLILPGMEVTTFQGHANAIGLERQVEFQLGSARLPTLEGLFDAVETQGGLISVNHPALPTGEACMGCGWSADTDWRRVAAIEVVNGSALRTRAEEGPLSGLPYWRARLDEGLRLTAIGGSDNHDPTDRLGRQSPVGVPATHVHTMDGSADALLAGVRSGRVFLDLEGAKGRTLDLAFDTPEGAVHMGGEIRLAPGETALGRIELSGADGLTLEAVAGGVGAAIVAGPDGPALRITRTSADGGRGWARIDARNADGRLVLIGNPVYIIPR